jgi:hypothetical protein
MTGPASCTSCDPEGCNKHFTIMDPKTNTGTCTPTVCPMCKPSACCTAGHKHYVINTNSMEGVCVRHDDTCMAVCMPRGNANPELKRVCTKGCNKMLKVTKLKPAGSKSGTHLKETDIFDIVVCQVDWKIVCSAQKAGTIPHCETYKSVLPMARCSFSLDVWETGPTCIANIVHADKHPQCPETITRTTTDKIRAECRKSANTEASLGEALGAHGGSGRRGGRGFLTTRGSFSLTTSSNSGGSEELGELGGLDLALGAHRKSENTVESLGEALGAHGGSGRRGGRRFLSTSGSFSMTSSSNSGGSEELGASLDEGASEEDDDSKACTKLGEALAEYY